MVLEMAVDAGKLRAAVGEFLENSSLHGLKYVAGERSLIERIFWIATFACGLGASSYYCYELWKDWHENPLIITSDPGDSEVYRDLFPALSICSIGRFSKRTIGNLMSSDKFAGIDRKLVEEALLYLQYPHLAPAASNNFYKDLVTKNVTMHDVMGAFRTASRPCDDFIIDCNWNETAGPCHNYFHMSRSDYGYCCTFNAGSYAVPAMGFDPQDIGSRKTYKSIGNGFHNGLQLTLNTDKEDYYVPTAFYDGFKAIVHHPDEFPMVNDYGFAVSAAMETIVSLGGIGQKYAPEIGGILLEKRGCYMNDERSLKYFSKYTESACLAECRIEKMLRQCKCRPFYFKENVSIPLCQLAVPSDNKCMADVEESIIRGNKAAKAADKPCQCLPTCERFSYRQQISTAAFPGQGFNSSRTGQRVNQQLANRTVQISYLAVHFNNEKDQVFLMNVKYSPADLISSVGGLLGLGLGFSFISAVELFYYIWRGLFAAKDNDVPTAAAAATTTTAVKQVKIRRVQVIPKQRQPGF